MKTPKTRYAPRRHLSMINKPNVHVHFILACIYFSCRLCHHYCHKWMPKIVRQINDGGERDAVNTIKLKRSMQVHTQTKSDRARANEQRIDKKPLF